MVIEIEETLTEFETEVVEAIRDSDLHTYADIANHIGSNATEVLSCLNGLADKRRGIVKRVGTKPSRYFMSDEEVPAVLATARALVDEILEVVDRPAPTPNSRRRRQVVDDEAQIDEPGGQNEMLGDVVEGEARVAASEADSSAESVKIAKALESSNNESEKYEEIATNGDLTQLLGLMEGQEQRRRERAAAKAIEGDPPTLACQTIKLSTGTIHIGIYCDLFKATPIERDLVEGIIQLVQAFEEKTEVPA